MSLVTALLQRAENIKRRVYCCIQHNISSFELPDTHVYGQCKAGVRIISVALPHIMLFPGVSCTWYDLTLALVLTRVVSVK